MQLYFKPLHRYLVWIYFLFYSFNLCPETTRSFQYNKNNQLINEEKANGHVIMYEYDPCGRIRKKTSTDGVIVQFSYDKNGNCTKMTDNHGNTIYTYDRFNRLLSVQFPNANQLHYKYDNQGQLIEMIYPNEWKISYDYDVSGRLLSINDKTGITKYEYNDISNTLTRVILPNGVSTEYLYDPVKRIKDVLHRHSDGSIIAGYHYTFDANGNRIQIQETGSFGVKTTVCTYDKLNRLISVEYPEGHEKYTYDEIGNRLTKETPDGFIQYEYDKSNHLVRSNDTEYFYDTSGNLIKKRSPTDTAELTYDAHDNLIEFRNKTHIVRYYYDGTGRRIAKESNGVITNYVNDMRSPLPQVVLKTNASNQICALYTYGISRLAEVLPKSLGFYLYDYPDRNVIAVIDANQKITNKYQYGSFGCTQKSLAESTNDFLYAGEAYEEETGLIYLRNRYYDPELGRFISADAEFGTKTNPQSLNPYTYVNNNPLNYIDPAGLRAAKACAYPVGTKTKDGTSLTGHGFWELTYDNGEVKTIGRYPRQARNNYDEICAGTVFYEWKASDTQIDKIIESVSEGPYLLVKGNCINGLERGLDILGVEYPSFKEWGVSLPTKAVIWLESLNGKRDFKDALDRDIAFVEDPDNYMPKIETTPKIPAVALTSGDVGGVSLNKTAELLGHISDVKSASYDPSSGQLIIVGKKKKIKLPEMDFDDLAVAVRSIYGLGGKTPQDPGISFDMDPLHPIKLEKIMKSKKKPAPFIVRYDGETKNTRFGYIMYEADRLLKTLSLGKDNITEKPFKGKVDGFKNLIQLYLENPVDIDMHNTRLWFVPKEMSIHKNRKGKDISFKKSTMKVMTETKIKDKHSKFEDYEEFAEFFTNNYEKFAKEYPVLKELKRLAKITAVVKWIKENNIPLDLSLFANYKPKYKDTPSTTPAIIVKHRLEINNLVSGRFLVGGISYHLDNSNFHEIITDTIDPLSAAALETRPSETVFKWTFKSPIDSEQYEAVAQTIERTAKVGNSKKAFLDISINSSSDSPLKLIRYYNSFNDNDIGFGRGWDVVCTRLRFPRAKTLVWNYNSVQITAYPELFVLEGGQEQCYKFLTIGPTNFPIFKSNEEESTITETGSGYTLQKSNGDTTIFTSDGKILTRIHNDQVKQTYIYNKDNRLTEIVNKYGKKIQLTYDHDRIVQACGPGEKHIKYSYDSNKQLSEVRDSYGVIEKYKYDNDKNLCKILNSKNDLLFTAEYDDYHRATTESCLGKNQTKSYDLKAHTLQTSVSGYGSFSKSYDSNYRLLQASDSHDRLVKITYEDGQTKPKKITDCLGNEKEYRYDVHGNIISITDAMGSRQRYWYNKINQLIAFQDGEGRTEYYHYDSKKRLNKISYLNPTANHNQITDLVDINDARVNITEYEYNQDTGQLQHVKQIGTIIQSFTYNQEGMLIGTTNSTGYTLHRDYDTRGRITKVWDSSGEGFEYVYDDRDRITSLASPSGKIEYGYDDMGNLCSIKDAGGNTTLHYYSTFGNLIRIEDSINGITHYEYDENDNITRIILPNKSIREIEYDALNRPRAEGW